MVNYDILFAIVFYAVLLIYYFTHKEKFEVQGKIFVMYKTQLGIKLMDKIAGFSPRLLNFLGGLGILVGFLGMFAITFVLIKGTIDLLTIKDAVPVIAPVLPGVEVPGLPTLGFWHWIFAILIVATIHEFSHGILARLHGIKVNSSGFAFLGPILAAFVEPDEEEMEKSSKYKQLSVFAAGPWSNVLTGLVFFVLSVFVVSPIGMDMMDFEGVRIVEAIEGYPSFESGLKAGDVVTEINGAEVTTTDSFVDVLKEVKPGDEINIKTEAEEFNLVADENPNDVEKGYIGVSVAPASSEIKEEVISKYGSVLPSLFLWFVRLIEWLFLISIGIGLANLLPLGPVDGGRMVLTGLSFFIKKEKNLMKVWSLISFFVLALIIINLWPYIVKLLAFMFGPIVALI